MSSWRRGLPARTHSSRSDHYARNRYWADEVVDRLDVDKALRMLVLDGEAHNGYAPGDDTVNKEVAARGIDTRVLHFCGEDRVDVSFSYTTSCDLTCT